MHSRCGQLEEKWRGGSGDSESEPVDGTVSGAERILVADADGVALRRSWVERPRLIVPNQPLQQLEIRYFENPLFPVPPPDFARLALEQRSAGIAAGGRKPPKASAPTLIEGDEPTWGSQTAERLPSKERQKEYVMEEELPLQQQPRRGRSEGETVDTATRSPKRQRSTRAAEGYDAGTPPQMPMQFRGGGSGGFVSGEQHIQMQLQFLRTGVMRQLLPPRPGKSQPVAAPQALLRPPRPLPSRPHLQVRILVPRGTYPSARAKAAAPAPVWTFPPPRHPLQLQPPPRQHSPALLLPATSTSPPPPPQCTETLETAAGHPQQTRFGQPAAEETQPQQQGPEDVSNAPPPLPPPLPAVPQPAVRRGAAALPAEAAAVAVGRLPSGRLRPEEGKKRVNYAKGAAAQLMSEAIAVCEAIDDGYAVVFHSRRRAEEAAALAAAPANRGGGGGGGGGSASAAAATAARRLEPYAARSKRDVAEYYGIAWSTLQPRLAKVAAQQAAAAAMALPTEPRIQSRRRGATAASTTSARASSPIELGDSMEEERGEKTGESAEMEEETGREAEGEKERSGQRLHSAPALSAVSTSAAAAASIQEEARQVSLPRRHSAMLALESSAQEEEQQVSSKFPAAPMAAYGYHPAPASLHGADTAGRASGNRLSRLMAGEGPAAADTAAAAARLTAVVPPAAGTAALAPAAAAATSQSAMQPEKELTAPVEQMLRDHIIYILESGYSVTLEGVCNCARQLGPLCGIPGFRASDEWLAGFAARHPDVAEGCAAAARRRRQRHPPEDPACSPFAQLPPGSPWGSAGGGCLGDATAMAAEMESGYFTGLQATTVQGLFASHVERLLALGPPSERTTSSESNGGSSPFQQRHVTPTGRILASASGSVPPASAYRSGSSRGFGGNSSSNRGGGASSSGSAAPAAPEAETRAASFLAALGYVRAGCQRASVKAMRAFIMTNLVAAAPARPAVTGGAIERRDYVLWVSAAAMLPPEQRGGLPWIVAQHGGMAAAAGAGLPFVAAQEPRRLENSFK